MPDPDPVLPPIEEKRSYVRQMFADIAPRYDLMNRLMTLGRDQVWRRTVVELCNLPRYGRLLDVATGTGDIGYEALKRDLSLDIVGVDLTREMMLHGRAKSTPSTTSTASTNATAAGASTSSTPSTASTNANAVGASTNANAVGAFTNANAVGASTNANAVAAFPFAQADALALPFADNSFDAATSGFMMRNVVDIRAAFAEQRRVVKPGGRIVCLEISLPRVPVFGPLFRFYFFKVVPLIGGIVSGQRSAYTYLPHSALRFPQPPELADIMRSVGLRDVQYRLAMPGIGRMATVAVHWGTK